MRVVTTLLGRVARLRAFSTLLFVVDWCWRAARYEKRIYTAALLGAVVWLALGGAVVSFSLLAGVWGLLFFGIPGALFTLFGFAFPIFLLIAYSGLFRRFQVWTPDGIHESWVNPDVEEDYTAPGFIRRLNNSKTIVVLSGFGAEWDGRPLPYRRARRLFSTQEVSQAVNKDRDQAHFTIRSKVPQIPVRMGAIAVIIAASLFIGLALLSSPPPTEATVQSQTQEVSP
jgi:hypothetical protein